MSVLPHRHVQPSSFYDRKLPVWSRMNQQQRNTQAKTHQRGTKIENATQEAQTWDIQMYNYDVSLLGGQGRNEMLQLRNLTIHFWWWQGNGQQTSCFVALTEKYIGKTAVLLVRALDHQRKTVQTDHRTKRTENQWKQARQNREWK